jgi:hypothetical protein
MLVGPGGIALTCTIQHLGRLQVTSLGLLDRSGEPIPDVARIREHRWLLAEQVAMAHRSYVPVAPILIATPFTRISLLEPPIGFTVCVPWRVSSALSALPVLLAPAEAARLAARLTARLRTQQR